MLIDPPRLAHEPDILGKFADEVASRGVAGEGRAVRLIFLVMVSRLLSKIVSLAVKGPSAGGKSHLVEAVLRYFPSSAYDAMTAMSERVLAYDDAPLAHRMIVIYEATGISGDMQSYLIRSLLSEGRINYKTVQKTKDGMKVLALEREGPTGLIVTTTATRLHPENETRLLSLVVSDTQDQTRAILMAQAVETTQYGDLGAWQDLQRWLEQGPTKVHIPYAATLADAIPPVAVRLRRDFPNVLALIRAHALLHRATRTVENGVITATIADYGAARDLVFDLVAEAVNRSVSASIRETVKAVANLTTIGTDTTVLKVAEALDLDKSAASRRVATATEAGYIQNLEERKGRPAKLVVGDPLPQDVSIMPSVEALERLHGCSSQGGANTKAAHTPAPGSHLESTSSNRTATVQPPVAVPLENEAAPNVPVALAPEGARLSAIDADPSAEGLVASSGSLPYPDDPVVYEMQRLLDAGELAGRAPLQLGPGIRLDDVERSVRVDLRSAHQEGFIGRVARDRLAAVLALVAVG